MKLSPPASSSDLEEAREVARRLHEQRRQAERPAQAPPIVVRRPPAHTAPVAKFDVVASPPAPARPPHHAPPAHAAPERPLQRPTPVAPPVPEPPPLPPTPPPIVAPRPTPAPPVHAAPPVQAPPVEPALRHAAERPAPPPRAPEPLPLPMEPTSEPWASDEEEAKEAAVPDALAALDDDAGLPAPDEAARGGDDDAIEIEETDTTLEDMVSSAGLPSDEEIVGPTDLEAGEPAVDDAESYEPKAPPAASFTSTPSPFDSSIESMSEELFDMPATPSWAEVVENCLMIAHARGAMLIDPAGQVLASNGFWPEPGPEPIATKLVAMMEKTLKDAPTRSVSAPVGAMHLTAWRVPLAEGLITVAFLGDTPLRAEARTPVDAEILRGAP